MKGRKEQQWDPMAAMPRDEHGYWLHPLINWAVVPEEADAGPYLRSLGLRLAVVSMYEDAPELFDRYGETGDPNISEWTPVPPDDGWILLAIYDTEDGPHACWAKARSETDQ